MVKRWHSVVVIVFVLSLLVGATSAQAAPLAADRGPWATDVSYVAGDTVTYNGTTYQAIQSHTSLTGWEPPNVPALWQVVSGPTSTQPSGPTNTPTRTPTRTNTPVGPTSTPTSGAG